MRPEVAKRIAQIRNKQLPEGYKKVNGVHVPADWSVCSLECCARFLDDKRVPIKEDERNIGPYPYYGASGIIDYVDNYIFDGEYILLGEDGANILDRSSPLAYRVSGKCWINNHAHVLQPQDGIDIDFLTYYLESLSYERYNTGTAQPKLNQETCKKIMIALPAIDEQRKIALLLAMQDKCIEYKENLVEEKQRQKKHLLQQLITGNLRLQNFAGKWKKEPLGVYLTEEKEIAHPDIQRRITVKLNLNGVEKRVPSATEKEDATVQYLRPPGKINYGKQNLFKGALGIVPNDLDGFQSSSDIPSFTVSNGLLAQWVFYWFSRESYYKNLEKIASGTGSKRIQTETFLALNILVPPMEEQRAIVECLSLVDKELELLQLDIEQEKQKKKALMQLLLTGIVRVKE